MASEQVDDLTHYMQAVSRLRQQCEEWKTRCISRGKENDELHDEIARLRRAFPVDRLREYDRRRKEAA